MSRSTDRARPFHRHRSQPSRAIRRLLLEALENRSLLAGFNFADFSDAGTLTLLGDASITADNRLRLTPAIGSQEGAAWFAADKPFVGAAFDTTFQFQLADNFDAPGGSDGFTFIVQNFAPTFLSGGGGPLGYHSLPNSVVVEFDTFQNTDVGDPSHSHISIHTNGTGPNTWHESLSLGSYNTNPILDDANVHTARITYSSGSMSVYLDDLVTPKLTVALDLANTLDLDAGRAWIGFTSTTGGGYETHDILNWQFDSTTPETTVSIADASVIEGNTGTTSLVFTVTRSGDLSAAAIADWTTANGTATAGSDFASASGQISFAPDQATQTVAITVSGDTAIEAHETLSLVLSNLTSGFLLDAVGTGTILNDEVQISIGDATGNEGSTAKKFLDAFIPSGSGGVVTPRGVVFGPDGNLYVGHNNAGSAGTVLRYDGQTGQFMDEFADSGIAPKQTTQVMFHGAYMFVSAGTHIFRFDAATGAAAPGAGQVGAEFLTPADAGESNGLHGIAVGPDGHLYVTSNVTHRVLTFDGSTGAFRGIYVAAGAGGLTGPPALNFGADGRLYVASSGSVLRYRGPLESNPGAFIDAFVPLGSGGLSSISGDGLHFGPDGDLYVNTSHGNSVLRYTGSTGAFVETVVSPGEGGLSRTGGLTFDNANRLYVASQNTHSVLRYGAESLAVFTVTLSAPSSVPVSINYSTSSGTATSGVDFSSTSGTVTFAPGQTSRTILVQTLDDTAYEGNETFAVNLSNPVGGAIVDGQGVGTIVDNDPQPTKFYVVDDGSANKTFEYGASGAAIENYAANSGNSSPRGAASTAAGDKVWVVDANKKVYVYNNAGGLLGSWTAGTLASNATVEGIATNGTDVWIVDARQDKVFKYAGAATRLSGSQNAASSFNLASGNGAPTDIVTDGASLWVVNAAANDKVFKYTVAGSSLGNWTISGAGGSPTGITLDPASPSHLWIVDSGTDRVYQFDNAVSRTSGSQSPSTSFALAAGNTNPQGIADPPAGGGYADSAFDSALLSLIGELDLWTGGKKRK